MDKVTEAIAHFIGLFQITEEQARLRESYESFKQAQRASSDDPQWDQVGVSFKSPYQFKDHDPQLHYVPPAPQVEPLTSSHPIGHNPPHIPVSPKGISADHPGYENIAIKQTVSIVVTQSAPSGAAPDISIDPPGQIAVAINQENHLTDNDYVGIGGSGLFVGQIGAPDAALEALVEQMHSSSALSESAPPGSVEEMADFIDNVAAELKAAAAAYEANDAPQDVGDGLIQTSFVVHDEAIEGIYVNGKAAIEMPSIQDYLPDGSMLAEDAGSPQDGPANQGVNGTGASASGSYTKGEGSLAQQPSVTLEAGGNTLVNSAIINNKSLSSTVTAIGGKNVEVNAIVQQNAWSDLDSIGSSLSEWSKDAQTTKAFNLASFKHVDPSESAAVPASNGTPQMAGFTKIDGDLIFMDWVKQLNFVTDNDVHTMSSSGSISNVVTGGNMAFNSTSLAEFGSFFDLIMVGKDFYDGSIIKQTNLLLDDDIAGAVNGFDTNGKGSVSASGNLLWNEAKLANVGGSAKFDNLPDHYQKTMDALASGKMTIDDGVYSDDAFMGLAGLRVLYVTGSIIDLKYISQMNILGDSDQVALAMDKAGINNADWTVNTGANVLLNTAAITDHDTLAKSYAAKGQYSDEFLVQSELVKMDNLALNHDADALINEAVAFLGDEAGDLGPIQPAGGSSDGQDVHPAHNDIMQSVVA